MKKIKDWFKNNWYVIVFFVVIYFLFNFELPYYILAPGGTIDISDRINVDNENEINGNLYLMYASEIKATIPTFIISKFNNKWDLFDNEERQISNESQKEIEKRNKIFLENSIDLAVYVAYNRANKKIDILSSNHYIMGMTSESTCDFKIGDKVLKVNNSLVKDVGQINNVVENSQYDEKIRFLIERDNQEKQVTCTVGKNKKIGVIIVTDYEYELDPKIELKFKNTESGSSGGMMLALDIYASIADEDLIKGRKIAGTGTIDKDGMVGEISGVKYKIIGANKSNIDLIFVPESNYEEAVKVKKDYGYDLDIVKVSTFDEVIEYLKK